MNKRIMLLLLTLLASKIYCMERADKPMHQEDVLNIYNELMTRERVTMSHLPDDHELKALMDAKLLRLDTPIGKSKTRFFEVLIAQQRTNALKLFIKNKAIESENTWNDIANYVKHHIDDTYKYETFYTFLMDKEKQQNEIQKLFGSDIEVFHNLIEYSPEPEKWSIIKKYEELLSNNPVVKDMVNRDRAAAEKQKWEAEEWVFTEAEKTKQEEVKPSSGWFKWFRK